MKKTSGNILFVILVAAALFAALSFAVTQSSRDTANVGKEQAKIEAAKLIDYLNTVKSAYTRLRHGRNCDTVSYYSSGANAPCSLTGPGGAGVPIYRNYVDPSDMTPIGLYVRDTTPFYGVGTDKDEVALIIYGEDGLNGVANFSAETCAAINEILDVPKDPTCSQGQPPISNHIATNTPASGVTVYNNLKLACYADTSDCNSANNGQNRAVYVILEDR